MLKFFQTLLLDYFTASLYLFARYPVAADVAVDYEVMHGAAPVKDPHTTNCVRPSSMESYGTEENEPQMHIYVHIGE